MLIFESPVVFKTVQIRAVQGVAGTSQGAYKKYVTKHKCQFSKALLCLKRFKYEQDKEGADCAQGAYKRYVTKHKRKPDEVLRRISIVLRVSGANGQDQVLTPSLPFVFEGEGRNGGVEGDDDGVIGKRLQGV